MNKVLKRYKWLFKNLTMIQLIRYFIMRKPIVKLDDIKNIAIDSYDIDIDMDNNVAEEGTLLIKPSGLNKISYILKELKKHGVNVTKGIQINDYKKYSKSVFYMVSNDEQNIWAYILDKYYSDSCNRAVLLYLDSSIDDIMKMKTVIRKKLGIDFFVVNNKGKRHVTSLTPIHSSNQEERKYEEYVIRIMLQEGKAELKDQIELIYS